MDWTKWDLDKVLNTPFVPIMMIINTLSERIEQERTENEQLVRPTDFSNPEVLQNILNNPDKF